MSARPRNKDGHWYYRFMYRGQDYCEGGWRTKTQAVEAERLKKDEVIDRYLHPEKYANEMGWPQAAQWWVEKVAAKKRENSDAARLQVMIRYFGDKSLTATKPEDIEEFLEALPKLVPKSIGDHTRNHYLALIKALYNRLKRKKKWSGENPALAVDMLKVPKARVRFLYPYEEEILTPAVVKDPLVFPYYVSGLYTGMRLSELIATRVRDIDLTIARLFVPYAKGNKSRYVPISEEFKPFLEAQTAGKAPDDHVLPKMPRWAISHAFTALCVSVGISDFTFHCTRHSFAARLLGKGVPLYKVSKILGHSNQQVTENHYGHLAFEDLQAAMTSIDGVMRHVPGLQQNSNGRLENATKKIENVSIKQ